MAGLGFFAAVIPSSAQVPGFVPPTLAFEWRISISGNFGGDFEEGNGTLGEVACFATDALSIPPRWVPCDGRKLPVSGNQALFVLLGSTFGSASAVEFTLPDMLGRTPVGLGNGYTLGQQGAGVYPRIDQLPPHTHVLPGGATSSAGSATPWDFQPPFLVLQPAIRRSGPDIGRIRWFAFDASRLNSATFLPCGGWAVSRSSESALFALIGTLFNPNPIPQVFNLPDLRGRRVLGTGNLPLGSAGGAANLVITEEMMPAHTHVVGGQPSGSTGGSAVVSTLPPFLTLNQAIARVTTAVPNQLPLRAGEVMTYAGPLPAASLYPCDGRSVTEADESELFAAIRRTYGVSNVAASFNLPDLQGRFTMASGAGAGLVPIFTGERFGSEVALIPDAALPVHSHLTVAAYGRATPIVSGDSSPSLDDGTDFGVVPLQGESVVHTFGFKNLGAGPVSTGQVTFEGSGFAASSFFVATALPATLEPGASALLRVRFVPVLGSGTTRGQLRLPLGVNGELYTFELIGRSVPVQRIQVQAPPGTPLLIESPVQGFGFPGEGRTAPPAGGLMDAAQLACGQAHNVVIKADGSVIAWGAASEGRLLVPAGLSPALQVASNPGAFHSVGVNTSGQVFAWGRNTLQQTNVPAGLSGAIQAVAGLGFSAALKVDGTVTVWGSPSFTLPGGGVSGIVKLAATQYGLLGLKRDGTLETWGPIPLPVGLAGIVDIGAGGSHFLALRGNGSVVAWGDNTLGQCNVPTTALSGVVSVTGGLRFSLARKQDGSVVGWGENTDGQLSWPSEFRASAIAGGDGFTMGITPRSSATVAFGNQADGTRSAARRLTVKNRGLDTLHLSPPLIYGPDAAQFSFTTIGYGATLQQNITADVDVVFNPSGVGSRIAFLRIASNDPDTPNVDIALSGAGIPPTALMTVSGNGVTIPNGKTIPALLDFTDFGGVNTTGLPRSLRFTVGNTGSAALTLTNTPRVSISGPHAADFSLSLIPASPIAREDGTTTFEITFDPSADGLRSAALSLASNDAGQNPYQFSIQGTGIPNVVDGSGLMAPPSLAMNWLICEKGFYLEPGFALAYADALLGEVRPFAGSSAGVAGWLPCDGRLLPISQNLALFNLLRTTFGGNGTTTFALPDLTGRHPVNVGAGFLLGQSGGASRPSVTEAQLPPHQHSLSGGLSGFTGGGEPVDLRQPYLVLNCIISTVPNGLNPPGWVRWFACPPLPAGYLPCDGRALSRNEYPQLFNVLGGSFGAGDATSTFNLPNLSGRVIIGSGTGLGLSPRLVGTQGGVSTHTLTLATMPTHLHLIDGNVSGPTGLGAALPTLLPYVVMNHAISLGSGGGNSIQDSTQPLVGEVRTFAGPLPAAGFAPCDGRVTTLEATPALAVLLSFTDANPPANQGAGFYHLPDSRGRSLTGAGGEEFRPLGRRYGAENASFLYASLAPHTHAVISFPEIAIFTGPHPLPAAERTNNTGVHSFGSILLGSSSPAQTFTIKNSGLANLALLRLALTGTHAAEFSSATPSLMTLNPDGSATLAVHFAPSSSGVKTATLEITSNDLDESPFLIQLTGIGNRAPVANPDSFTATRDQASFLSPRRLTANDVDPDGDVLTLTAVASPGTHGTVSLLAGNLIYTPTTGYEGPDRFTYTIADPGGATAIGIVSVTVTPAGAVSSPGISATPEGLALTFAGTPGSAASVQFSDDGMMTWQTLLGPITIGANGLVDFLDQPEPLPPARFYRLRSLP